MVKEIRTFGNNELKKIKFSHCKNLILLKYVGIDNMLISVWFFLVKKDFKYSIGHKDDHYKTKTLDKMLPKTSAYVKGYDGETKWKIFLIKNIEFLKKYDEYKYNLIDNEY